ncbi:sugar nucleotide-binding protein [Fluviispira multicolorata]|uniref:dTDP-4-dehydrorhamnose reductase n=1 Tax=Fluviispira multicolorata TaxID=2654512 RepID=A0A833JAZ5_9BACT|nr:sugar nucleotide-binding protein [Fluviispira multicolorata]KAB8028020.1 sugar nucleotide-binding protein [Fluviispira multicolorata]
MLKRYSFIVKTEPKESQSGKILLIGSTGLVGSNLISLFNSEEIIHVSRHHKNWLNSNNIFQLQNDVFLTPEKLFTYANYTSCVIFLAFPTDLDELEKLNDEKQNIFVNSFYHFVNFFSNHQVPILFASTDAVLWGVNPLLRSPNTPPVNPLNVYAKLKIRCEEIILNNAGNDSIIIRITPIGFHPFEPSHGFLGKMCSLIRNQNIEGYSNNEITPISVNQLVKWIYDWAKTLRKKQVYLDKIYHLCSQDSISKYELLLTVLKNYKKEKELIKTQMKTNTLAKRAINQCLIPTINDNTPFFKTKEVIENILIQAYNIKYYRNNFSK